MKLVLIFLVVLSICSRAAYSTTVVAERSIATSAAASVAAERSSAMGAEGSSSMVAAERSSSMMGAEEESASRVHPRSSAVEPSQSKHAGRSSIMAHSHESTSKVHRHMSSREIAPSSAIRGMGASSAIRGMGDSSRMAGESQSQRRVMSSAAAGPRHGESSRVHAAATSRIRVARSEGIVASSRRDSGASRGASRKITPSSRRSAPARSSARPTRRSTTLPPVRDCRTVRFNSMLKASGDEGAGSYTLSQFVVANQYKLAITELSHAAQAGCGVPEMRVNGAWRSLSGVSANSALVLSASTGFRFRRTNTRCSSQCHGRVGFKYANVRDTNADASNVDVQSSKICAVELLLQPGPELCPACNIHKAMNLTVQEDSGRTCFKISDYVTVDMNTTSANIGSFNASGVLRNKYERALNALKGKTGVRPRGSTTKLGRWSKTADVADASKPLTDLKIVNTTKFLCFRPNKNKYGAINIKYSCATEIGRKTYSSREYDFDLTISSVNDPPRLDKSSLKLPPLPNNYVDGDNNGKRVSELVSSAAVSPEGITSLGMAIWKINSDTSKVDGVWQWRNNSGAAWQNINSSRWTAHAKGGSGHEMFLLKAHNDLRFKLKDTSDYWSKIYSIKYASLLFRVWDMSDQKSSGISNMTGVTTLSQKLGQIVQHRIGCFGPGSQGGATDACGKCGGDNSTCAGCDGVANSGAKYDRCQRCFGGTTGRNRTVRDCFGGCGTARKDACGICQRIKNGNINENKFKDCNNVCKNAAGANGIARTNPCGHCVGGTTGKTNNYGKDSCGVCGGDNSTCLDCAGTPAGTKTRDLCKICLEPGDSNRDECSALGAPTKLCASTGDKIDAPVGMVRGKTFASAACQFDTTSVTTTKKNSKKLTMTVADLVSGAYNVSCVLAGESSTLYATSKVFVVKYSEPAVTGLNKTTDKIESTKAKQNLEVTGTNFPNSGYVGCLMTANGKTTTLKGQYVSATSVICKGFPKQRKSIRVTIALRFCEGDSSSTSTSATFSWTADLPRVTSAAFTNCRTLKIRWNGPVEANHAGACNLTKYFPSDTAKLSTAKCRWGRRDLKINLNQASLTSGNTLTLDNSALNAFGAADTVRVNATTVLTASPPSNRQLPKVRLNPSTATTIGKCDKFRISYYTRVRAGMTALWTISGTTNDTRWNTEMSGKQNARLDIPDKNVAVNFTLKATNCFGDSTQESVLITKEDKEVPRINLRTVEYTTTVSKAVRIRAPAKYGCAGVAAQTLVYTWTFSPEFDTSNVAGLGSPKITIPKGTLTAGTTYTATITVSVLGESDVSSSKAATITVSSQPLKGFVQGAQIVKDTGKGKFKARLIDPDESTDTESYSWTISDGNGDGVVNKDYSSPSFADSAELEVDFNLLDVSAGTYTIQCVMTKGIRTLTKSMTFELTSVTPPNVEITGIDGKVNWPELIFIECKINSATAGTYAWTSEDYPAVANLPGTTGNYRAGKEKVANLLIAPKDVTEEFAAQEYTFNLVATQDGTSFTSTVVFEVNLAPSAGSLTVDQTSGEATVTEFTATVGDNGCIDDDGVKYAFGYTDTGSGISFLFAPQDNNFLTTTLGAGNVKFFVRCIDPYDAYVSAESQSITVAKPAVTAAALDNAANAIGELAKGGDAEAIAKAGLDLANSFAAGEGVTLTAEQQEAQQKMLESIATAVLAQPPVVGDLEAGKQFISVGGSITGEDTSAETKQNMAASNAKMLGLPQSVIDAIFGASSSRRRRRSVSGTYSTDVATVTANPDQAMAKDQINMQFGMVTVSDYGQEQLNQKVMMFTLLDQYSIGLCKSMQVGQADIDIVATDATMRTVKLVMDDGTATTRALGCASSATDCSATVQSPPFTLKATGINKEVCLASTTMVGDYHSTSEPSHTALSNIVRIRMWNSTAEIRPSSPADINITIYSNANTTKSYKCMIWDNTNKQWTNTSMTTVNPTGELDSASSKYHVTCQSSQLGDFMLIEGPEIAVEVTTTAVPTTTAAPTTQAATAAATTKSDTVTAKVETTTKAPTAATTKAPTSEAEASTAAAAAVTTTAKPSTAAPTTAAPTTAAPTTAAPTTAAPTTAAPTTAAPSTAAPATQKPTTAAAITVHPDDVDTIVSFVLHQGNCSDVYDSQTKDSSTESAKTQVAKLLDIPHPSMENINLTCSTGPIVTMAWLQTPRDLPGNATVKSTIAKLMTILSSGNFTIVINNKTLSSVATVATVPQALTTAATEVKSPENYDREVSFTLHKGNCSDVFTNETERIAAQNEVKPQLATAMGVSVDSIKKFALKCGSVLAGWTQTNAGLTGNVTVKSVLAKLETAIKSNALAVKVGNLVLKPDNASFTVKVIPPPTSAPPATNAPGTSAPVTQPSVKVASAGLSGGAIAGIIIGVLLLIAIVVVVVVVYIKKIKPNRKSKKIKPADNDLELQEQEKKPTNATNNPGYADSD